MISTRRYMAWVAGAVVAVALTLASAACAPPPLKQQFGDGTFTTDEDIVVGTYETANTGPHSGTAQCEWTVRKPSGSGTVLLRSVNPDSTIQTVYIGPDESITTSLCGTWVWKSRENLTRTNG